MNRNLCLLSRGAFLVLLVASCRAAGQNSSTKGEEQMRSRTEVLAGTRQQSAAAMNIKCGLPVVSLGLAHRGEIGLSARNALKVLITRPLLETSIVAGNFRIHFDTTGADAPAMLDANHARVPNSWREFVDSAASIIQHVAIYEIDSLGYQAPPSDDTLGGGPEYDIYVMDLGALYGETDPDDDAVTDGGRSTTFMKIHNDFSFVTPDVNKGIPALRVTLAHEFHHAIQIGSYAYWPSEVYFHEITSVWMEDVVYTGVNDYYNYLFASWSQFFNPDVPFNSNGVIMYSRGVWGQFIARKFGRDAMRRTWEVIRTTRPLQAINVALRTYYSTTLATAFSDWTLWNYFTGSREDPAYYPEGANYPEVGQMPVDFTSSFRVVSGSLAPLSARYHEVMGTRDSITLALSNIDVTSALAGGSPEGYTYNLSSTVLDDSYVGVSPFLAMKFDAPVLANWWTWSIVNGIVGAPTIAEGTPFPNPFFSDGSTSIRIPTTAFTGTLAIYSSSMALVYSSFQASTLYFGKRVFTWDGKTSKGALAQSGVYLFALSLEGRTVTGKFVIVRR